MTVESPLTLHLFRFPPSGQHLHPGSGPRLVHRLLRPLRCGPRGAGPDHEC